MRLVTFSRRSGAPWRTGVRAQDRIVDLLAVHAAAPVADWAPTPAAVMEHGLDGMIALRALVESAESVAGSLVAPGDIVLGPVIPAPSKIVAIGLNYRRHAEESGMAIPEFPIVFNKFPNALAGPGETVTIPRVTSKADYEVELAVVIGARASGVSVEDALSHVWGYATSNDLSARDLQFRTAQWMLGKTLDGFLPIGPDLVTTDEVPDPQALRLRTWLNGELRQDSNTSDMIFPVAELVSYCSHHFTLVPGDILITGTPAGVIAGMKEPVWLKGGDVVEVEVEGLGRLVTPLVAEG